MPDRKNLSRIRKKENGKHFGNFLVVSRAGLLAMVVVVVLADGHMVLMLEKTEGNYLRLVFSQTTQASLHVKVVIMACFWSGLSTVSGSPPIAFRAQLLRHGMQIGS